MRLAAQARKYHLGLIFATQNPKDIENKIVANCSTHYYGKVNSPAAIDAVREMIRSKGGSGDEIPKLPRSHFYVHNADAHSSSPIKVAIPLCLSRHPDHPLDESQILQKAAASRKRLNR
jgi:DNA helicase HerA-like ATPase